jgi:drug/metabolite transporter (DMT)-like permease
MTKPAFPRIQAIGILLFLGVMFGANHIAARIAFDHGVGLSVAVLVRSGVTALVLLGVLWIQKTPLTFPIHSRPWMLLLGVLISVQSLLLYSAVARIPVALALLAFNTFPLLYMLLCWAMGGKAPGVRALAFMGIILLGLAFALDAPDRLAGVATGASTALGIAFGLGAAAVFTLSLWVTENRLKQLPGALRSGTTMAIVGVAMVAANLGGVLPGGNALLGAGWPHDSIGWAGLGLLTVLYGGAFSTLFMLMPRLDMPRNAPASNIEPIAALVMGWMILGQTLKPSQIVGALIVMGGIVLLASQSRR